MEAANNFETIGKRANGSVNDFLAEPATLDQNLKTVIHGSKSPEAVSDIQTAIPRDNAAPGLAPVVSDSGQKNAIHGTREVESSSAPEP